MFVRGLLWRSFTLNLTPLLVLAQIMQSELCQRANLTRKGAT